MKSVVNPNAIRAIYLFGNLKMVFWAIGMLVFNSYSVNTSIVPIIEYSTRAQIALLIMGLIGLANYFVKEAWVYVATSVEMSLFWVYALLLYGVYNTSFFRTLPETAFILLMTAYLCVKKGKIE